MDIKTWILAARKHGGYTQKELGEAIGRTKQNVSGWEAGSHEPSFSQMAVISTITHYPLPPAGYKPKRAFSPYATALAELVDRQPEEDRQVCATIAKAAIDQHLKDVRKAARAQKQATPAHPAPSPTPRKK